MSRPVLPAAPGGEKPRMPEPLSYTIQFTDGSSRTVNHASVPDINDEFILFANQDRRVIGVFPLHSIKEIYSAAADVRARRSTS